MTYPLILDNVRPCDHCFIWMATIPPTHCLKCGVYLGKQPNTQITCEGEVPLTSV